MEEEERPRKIQKYDVTEDHEVEPLMTGAIGGANDNIPEHAETPNDMPAPTIEGESEEPTPVGNGSEGGIQKLSKRQLRRQRQREQWEAQREQRKAKRKEKNAARKERKREAWKEAKRQGKDTKEELAKLFPSTNRGVKPARLPITLVIDCGFDDYMTDKERVSLGQQLTRSYSENNKSAFNAHFVISSFNKLLRERFDTVLHKMYESWKGVRVMEEDYLHAANQASEWMRGPQGGEMVGPFANKTDTKPEDGEIIYLSSDSSETLTELKPYSTYIIGGLVDKNRHKGVCHRRATEMGIRTAKLPIGDYIQMASRSVLATNHVVEIMVRWLQLQDWGEAFMRTIPTRKGGVLKSSEKQKGSTTPSEGDVESGSERVAATDTVNAVRAEGQGPADE